MQPRISNDQKFKSFQKQSRQQVENQVNKYNGICIDCARFIHFDSDMHTMFGQTLCKDNQLGYWSSRKRDSTR